VLGWFQDVLDFDLREELVIEGEDVGKWLSVSPLVHEIAFVEEPEASLNHVAYYLKSRGDLFRAADVLKEHGIEIRADPATTASARRTTSTRTTPRATKSRSSRAATSSSNPTGRQ